MQLGLPDKFDPQKIGITDEMQINSLESLDLLKQDCFYTNYLEEKKSWFSVIDDLPIEQQRSIAESQFIKTKIEYHMTQIAHKYTIIQSDSLEKIKKEQHLIEARKLHKLRMTSKYRKMDNLSTKTIELKFANRRAVQALNEEKRKKKK